MTAVTDQPPDTEASVQTPHRVRKHVQYFRALSMADALRLVEQTGQRGMVLRLARAARQLECQGERRNSLAELAAFAQPSPGPKAPESLHAKVDKLRALLGEVGPLAADVGSALQDAGQRSLCFKLSRCSQRAAAELGRWGLWNDGQ